MIREQQRSLIWHTAIRNLEALGYDFKRNVIEFDKHVIDFIYSVGAGGDYWGCSSWSGDLRGEIHFRSDEDSEFPQCCSLPSAY